MHTLLDKRGGIPVQIHVGDGRWHDSNILDDYVVELVGKKLKQSMLIEVFE